MNYMPIGILGMADLPFFDFFIFLGFFPVAFSLTPENLGNDSSSFGAWNLGIALFFMVLFPLES